MGIDDLCVRGLGREVGGTTIVNWELSMFVWIFSHANPTTLAKCAMEWMSGDDEDELGRVEEIRFEERLRREERMLRELLLRMRAGWRMRTESWRRVSRVGNRLKRGGMIRVEGRPQRRMGSC